MNHHITMAKCKKDRNCLTKRIYYLKTAKIVLRHAMTSYQHYKIQRTFYNSSSTLFCNTVKSKNVNQNSCIRTTKSPSTLLHNKSYARITNPHRQWYHSITTHALSIRFPTGYDLLKPSSNTKYILEQVLSAQIQRSTKKNAKKDIFRY